MSTCSEGFIRLVPLSFLFYGVARFVTTVVVILSAVPHVVSNRIYRNL